MGKQDALRFRISSQSLSTIKWCQLGSNCRNHGCEATAAKLSPVLRWPPRKLLMCDSPWAHTQALTGLECQRPALLAGSEAGYQFLQGRCCLMSESLLKSERSTEGREMSSLRREAVTKRSADEGQSLLLIY